MYLVGAEEPGGDGHDLADDGAWRVKGVVVDGGCQSVCIIIESTHRLDGPINQSLNQRPIASHDPTPTPSLHAVAIASVVDYQTLFFHAVSICWQKPTTTTRTRHGPPGRSLAPEEDGGDGEDGGADEDAHEEVHVAVVLFGGGVVRLKGELTV